MNYYVVREQRMIEMLDLNVRKSPLGVVNWFVDDLAKLHILLNLRNINYVYSVNVQSLSDLRIELSSYLTKDTEMLGFYEFEKEDEQLAVVTLSDIYNSEGA